MSGRRPYQILTCILCGLVAVTIAAIIGRPTMVDGPILDLVVKARELAFPPAGDPEQSPIVVVALDNRSLEDPEIAPYPRTFLALIWASVLNAVFDAGAKVVGFDLLFSYSANRFSPNLDAPFLATIGKHRKKVVLARVAATIPAKPYLAALRNDSGGLGLAELTADADGRRDQSFGKDWSQFRSGGGRERWYRQTIQLHRSGRNS